jgi:hypothetical protein
MEHPLISNIDELTPDELIEKINELNSKLTIGMRSGNSHLCNQIRMAIESYTNKLREKQAKAYEESNQNFKDKINIS